MSRTGHGQPKRPVRAVSPARGKAAGESAPDGDGFWATQAAWYALVGAFVVSTIVLKQTGLYGSVYFLKDWIIRLLVAVALALWGYAVFKGRAAVRWHRVAWLGAVFLAWAAASVAFSVSPATALIGTAAGEAGWLALASSAVGGFLMLQLADRASRIRLFMRAVTLTALVAASYGVIQTLGLDPVVYGNRPWGAFRAFGTLGNPDMYGAFTVLVLPLVIGLVLSEDDKRWKTVGGVAFVLVGLTCLTSLTRAAWVGAVVGAVVLAILCIRLRPKVGRFELALVGVLVALMAVATVVSLGAADSDSNIGARATNTAEAAQKSTVARFEMWRIASAAIAERPISGWGPDTFLLAFEDRRTEAFSALVDPGTTTGSAHNWVLQTAVETGLPGLLLLAGFFAAVAVLSVRWIWRVPEGQGKSRLPFAAAWAACAGFLAASLLAPGGSHPSRLLLWCLLGILLSPLASRAERVRGVTLRVVAAVAMVAGVGFMALTAVAVIADDRATLAADVAAAPDARAAAGETAMTINPLSAEYAIAAMNAHVNLVPPTGLAAEGGRQPAFDAALAAADQAISLEPTNPYRTAGKIGLLLIGGQDVDPQYARTAVGVAEAAVARWPNHLELAYWYAQALADTGQLDEAVAELRQVLDVRPGYGRAALLMSDLLVRSGDIDGARAVLQASLDQVKNEEVQARLDALGGQGQ